MKKLVQNRNLVFHADAEINTLLMLVSFATSVTFTRAFLFLTGYPQFGNDELHISHILWGDLLIFALKTLLTRARYSLSSVSNPYSMKNY